MSKRRKKRPQVKDKGIIAEDRVESVLQWMRQAAEISKFTRHARFSDMDKTGIDFTVYPRHQQPTFHIQVKSSMLGIWKYKEKYPGKDICFVLGHQPLDKIRSTILKYILGEPDYGSQDIL